MCNLFVEKYNSYSDSELIASIRNNNQDAFEALFYRYLPLLKKLVAKSTSLGEFDDLLQDATISFYYAVQMYDDSRASFGTFLSVCVDRSLKSTIRKASAQKRIPEELISDIDDTALELPPTQSAEQEYFDAELSKETSGDIEAKLSALEFRVLKSFLNTESYDSTAAELGVTRKTVDNALSRVRKKLNS